MKIKIFLADDHTIVRHSLCSALEQEEDFEVVGQAENGLTTIELVRELSPDIVVMDVSMPDMNGIEATRHIVKETPRTKVIGLSMHSSNKYVREMFRAGASGYLLKESVLGELIEAIKVVFAGNTYISPSIGDVIVQDYLSAPEKHTSVYSLLSEREREVLQLLAEGYTTKQIGQFLHVSPKTVESHRLRVMNKLNLDNIAQMTKYAIQEGLTGAEP